MGIAFVTKKAEKFKQQKDEAFADQMASENLLSGLPETIQKVFRCNSTGQSLPEVGTLVLLYEKNRKIDVFLQNQQIGTVMSQDAVELKKIMAHTNTDVLTASVIELQPISKIFLVQLRPTKT
jgi:hypothetical protein